MVMMTHDLDYWMMHLKFIHQWFWFCTIHSILITNWFKQYAIPIFGRRYRVIYNFGSLFHFMWVEWYGYNLLGSEHWEFFSNPIVMFIQYSIHICGWVYFVTSICQYTFLVMTGMGNFVPGFYKREQRQVLVTTGYLAYIRHPIYSAGIYVSWSIVSSPYFVTNAICSSLYMIIGTLIEEPRVRAYYGDAYRHYEKHVPRWIPNFPLKPYKRPAEFEGKEVFGSFEAGGDLNVKAE